MLLVDRVHGGAGAATRAHRERGDERGDERAGRAGWRRLQLRQSALETRSRSTCHRRTRAVGMPSSVSGTPPPCEVRACPDRSAQARSSPGAPHRGGGLPASEPGLDAGAHDLDPTVPPVGDAFARPGARLGPGRPCAAGSAPRAVGVRAADPVWRPGKALCYGPGPGRECQREAPASWPATLHRGGVPRVMTRPDPSGSGKRARRPRMIRPTLVSRRHIDLLRTASAVCPRRG